MGYNSYKADLHIHTCLSPCGELEMSPLRIAQQASKIGLDLIAVCDHNSAENVPAVIKAGQKVELSVIPGMEITTSEEIHIVGLFPSPEAAMAAQEVVYDHLPGENNEDVFGIQVIANEEDEVVGINTRLLIGATGLSVEEVVDLIHKNGGLAIASHVDREGFSLIGQLGFVPDGLELDGLEISARTDPAGFDIPDTRAWPVITSSDAHKLSDMGTAVTSIFSAGTGFDEVELAIKGESGRRIDTGGI